MRGKVPEFPLVISIARITPAYAGKSLAVGRRANGGWDHPRLCGEKSSMTIVFFLVAGSPPPMRGKVYFENKYRHVKRITPAYAGKSSDTGNQYAVRPDHPRLCGEKTKKILKQRYFFHQPASFSFSLQYT